MKAFGHSKVLLLGCNALGAEIGKHFPKYFEFFRISLLVLLCKFRKRIRRAVANLGIKCDKILS